VEQRVDFGSAGQLYVSYTAVVDDDVDNEVDDVTDGIRYTDVCNETDDDEVMPQEDRVATL